CSRKVTRLSVNHYLKWIFFSGCSGGSPERALSPMERNLAELVRQDCKQGAKIMSQDKPKDGAPGTTDQSPRWEGPEEKRPRGYRPAKDDPEKNRDAAGENLKDPQKTDLSDSFKKKDD